MDFIKLVMVLAFQSSLAVEKDASMYWRDLLDSSVRLDSKIIASHPCIYPQVDKSTDNLKIAEGKPPINPLFATILQPDANMDPDRVVAVMAWHAQSSIEDSALHSQRLRVKVTQNEMERIDHLRHKEAFGIVEVPVQIFSSAIDLGDYNTVTRRQLLDYGSSIGGSVDNNNFIKNKIERFCAPAEGKPIPSECTSGVILATIFDLKPAGDRNGARLTASEALEKASKLRAEFAEVDPFDHQPQRLFGCAKLYFLKEEPPTGEPPSDV
jgi:hypothetical protein